VNQIERKKWGDEKEVTKMGGIGGERQGETGAQDCGAKELPI